MKYFNQGAFFRVTVSENEVYSFGREWPGSNLCHGDRASFTFDKRNGDLVDLQITHAFAGPVNRDCPSVSALAENAKKYGFSRMAADK